MLQWWRSQAISPGGHWPVWTALTMKEDGNHTTPVLPRGAMMFLSVVAVMRADVCILYRLQLLMACVESSLFVSPLMTSNDCLFTVYITDWRLLYALYCLLIVNKCMRSLTGLSSNDNDGVWELYHSSANYQLQLLFVACVESSLFVSPLTTRDDCLFTIYIPTEVLTEVSCLIYIACL